MNGINHEAFHELKRLFADDTGGLGKTLQIFLITAEQLVTKLHAAHQSGNLPELVRIAHGLGSSCGNVGATGMLVICRELEQSGRNNAVPANDEKLKNLAREFGLVKVYLTAQLEKIS